MNIQRLWKFIGDMNFDSSITISDVWLWVKWLYFYPGDGFLYLLMNKVPGIAHFFEITESSYGGFLSGAISFLAWVFVGICFIATYEEYEKSIIERRKKRIETMIAQALKAHNVSPAARIGYMVRVAEEESKVYITLTLANGEEPLSRYARNQYVERIKADIEAFLGEYRVFVEFWQLPNKI